ncbi:MAG: DUF4012 domain-containing protein, partial [Nocardioides sp.]|uniref:DUF4012 domain-containing protein n=1 Tax=Nocardioides sp. TaxID=35761 RepID=UPI00238E907C
RFFQDPNFTPDFPRAAEVFNAFWSEKYPDVSLDGVISLDVVSLSYLLEGTGPVRVGDLTLTSTNAVDVLLRDVYEEPDPAKQNEIFESVARAVFESATSTLKQPVAFVEGLSRAARERRFHVASFDKTESLALSGTLVEGRLSRDLDASPVVDIALNDATASKMSYYLRYNTDIQSVSCDEEGRQQLEVTMTLSQSISPAAARQLPRYVTGSAQVGMDRGNQFVRAHIFAPLGGDIRDIKINGSAVATPNVVDLSGRPAVTLAVLIDSLEDVVVTMRLTTGGGQDSDGVISSTPSVVPGLSSKTFSSSCA